MPKIWTMLVCALALGCGMALETPVDITLGKAFTLEPGRGSTHLARFGPANWNLEFVQVVNDSRCPKGVACIWAGDAELALRVVHANLEKRFSLHTGLQPHSALVMGYRLRLNRLDPDNESGKILSYRAIFTLEKP